MHGTAFLAHQHVAKLVLLENLVVNRKDSAAGITEYDINALILQGFDHNCGTVHFDVSHDVLVALRRRLFFTKSKYAASLTHETAPTIKR